MGRLAKVMQGQSQPGLKAYKKGGAVEGQKALTKAMSKSFPQGATISPAKKVIDKDRDEMKCGGKVKK